MEATRNRKVVIWLFWVTVAVCCFITASFMCPPVRHAVRMVRCRYSLVDLVTYMKSNGVEGDIGGISTIPYYPNYTYSICAWSVEKPNNTDFVLYEFQSSAAMERYCELVGDDKYHQGKWYKNGLFILEIIDPNDQKELIIKVFNSY